MISPARIARIFSRVRGLHPDHSRLSPLPGGISNLNYRVETGQGALVLRIGGDGTRQLGIDRRRECACARLAAAAGVGPEVMGFVPSEAALITRFIPGQGLTAKQAARPAALRGIVKSLLKIHQGPRFPGRFSAFETVRGYYRSALKHKVAFPPSLPRVFEIMGKIEAALGRPRTSCPCHNDLLAGNLIDDGRRIRILDWEYAAMGDPFFDLGNLAANLRLDEKACRLLLRYYFGGPSPSGLARLHLYRLASDLRESFWGFLQSGVSSLDFDFRGYARSHLNRFLRQASTPRFKGWLQGAAETPR